MRPDNPPNETPSNDNSLNDGAGTTLASVGRRFAARCIDSLALGLVWMLPAVAFGGVRSRSVFDVPMWLVWASWVTAVVYEIALITWNGQTIGKRLVGIRVADAVTGAVPNIDQALRRALPTLTERVPVIGMFSFFFYLPALWRPRRQGIHDRLAGTVVVTV